MLDVPITRRPTTQELETATTVELLTYVRDVLVRQDKASTDAIGGCAYRGTSSCVCAVGALIPTDAYVEQMEGCSVTTLLSDWPVLGAVLEKHVRALQKAQSIHDTKSTRVWRQEFDRLIAVYKEQG